MAREGDGEGGGGRGRGRAREGDGEEARGTKEEGEGRRRCAVGEKGEEGKGTHLQHRTATWLQPRMACVRSHHFLTRCWRHASGNTTIIYKNWYMAIQFTCIPRY